LFENLSSEELNYDHISRAASKTDYFTTTLLNIAERTIPKTSKQAHRIRKPWFSDECKAAIAERKHALKQFKSNPTQSNLSNLRVFRAKARRTIRICKRNSWQSYVSRLNSQTPMKKIWNMVRRISGKPTPMTTSHLKVNGATIEQPNEIANSIASTLSYNSSTNHYTDRFRRYKAHQEKRPIDIYV